MPRDKEIPHNYGDAQTCPRQTAIRPRAATMAFALHVTHHDRATSSVTWRAAVLFCVLKKTFEKCFAKRTFILKILVASSAVEGKNTVPAEPWHGCWAPLQVEAKPQSVHLPDKRELNIFSCICIARTNSRHYVLRRYKQKYKPVQFEWEEWTLSFTVFCWKKKNKHSTLNTYSAGDQRSCETILLHETQKRSRRV